MMSLIRAEPIIALLLGNTAFWLSLFPLASAFGHPVSDVQQHAIIGFAAFVSAFIARACVTPTTKG